MDADDFDEYVVRIYRTRRHINSEYHDFIRDLFYSQIEPRLRRNEADIQSALQQWGRTRSEFTDAMRQVRRLQHDLLSASAGSETTLSPRVRDALQVAQRPIKEAVGQTMTAVIEPGIADVVRDNYDLIIDQMRVDDLPQLDVDLVDQLGSDDPRRELSAILYQAKAQRDLIRPSGRRDTDIMLELRRINERVTTFMEQQSGIEQKLDRVLKARDLGTITNVAGGIGLLLQDTSIAAIAASHMATPVDVVGSVASLCLGLFKAGHAMLEMRRQK